MLPATERFASMMRSLGVRDSDTVVVYDGSGNNLSAPRAWWMLRVFGHADVALLDGGLARWRTEGRLLEGGLRSLPPGDFTARLDPSRVVTAEQVESAVRSGSAQVVDARSAARFAGSAPEPRAGLRGGHIPGSRSVPFSELVREDGTMLRGAELAGVFERAGVDLRRPVIATCGSGVTACALLHALHTLGQDDVFLYDGSWTEWGARSDLPVESGLPPPA